MFMSGRMTLKTKIDILTEAVERNASAISAYEAKVESCMSALDEKLDLMAVERSKVLDKLSSLEKTMRDTEKQMKSVGDTMLNGMNRFENLSEQLVRCSNDSVDKSVRTLRAVQRSISESSRASVNAAEALINMCTEMISEYNREVNESIRLLLADSLVSKIPDTF